MPIYEYLCSECKLNFELLRPLSQAGQEAECPHCHKSARCKMSTFACFSTNESGISARVAGTGSSCTSCSSGSCDSCGH
ncbi:FmdB family zinc ribbon protein [Chloroflexota bacterium]